jgi:5-carboxymethyl-2-hydroxymuconate isomerase
MPHLRIEVTDSLASALDLKSLLEAIHRDIADHGWAAINDLKTRVLVCVDALAGLDHGAEQLVATLITTNPRPPDVQRAMTDCVLRHLQQAVRTLGLAHWVQCCVFMQATPKSDYSKWQWMPPTPPSP